MQLQLFLRQRMAALNIRRFDALKQGSVADVSLLAALRDSLLVGAAFSAAFDAALAATQHQHHVDAREAAHVRELQARRDFVPHVWVEHERRVPQPFFVVAWLGIERYKRLDLPAAVLAADHPADVLLDVAAYLRCVPQDPDAAVLMKGPFGRATHFCVRTTYDAYYVYSIAEQCFIELREERPVVGEVIRFDQWK
jgi:hypothetical protein